MSMTIGRISHLIASYPKPSVIVDSVKGRSLHRVADPRIVIPLCSFKQGIKQKLIVKNPILSEIQVVLESGNSRTGLNHKSRSLAQRLTRKNAEFSQIVLLNELDPGLQIELAYRLSTYNRRLDQRNWVNLLDETSGLRFSDSLVYRIILVIAFLASIGSVVQMMWIATLAAEKAFPNVAIFVAIIVEILFWFSLWEGIEERLEPSTFQKLGTLGTKTFLSEAQRLVRGKPLWKGNKLLVPHAGVTFTIVFITVFTVFMSATDVGLWAGTSSLILTALLGWTLALIVNLSKDMPLTWAFTLFLGGFCMFWLNEIGAGTTDFTLAGIMVGLVVLPMSNLASALFSSKEKPEVIPELAAFCLTFLLSVAAASTGTTARAYVWIITLTFWVTAVGQILITAGVAGALILILALLGSAVIAALLAPIVLAGVTIGDIASNVTNNVWTVAFTGIVGYLSGCGTASLSSAFYNQEDKDANFPRWKVPLALLSFPYFCWFPITIIFSLMGIHHLIVFVRGDTDLLSWIISVVVWSCLLSVCVVLWNYGQKKELASRNPLQGILDYDYPQYKKH